MSQVLVWKSDADGKLFEDKAKYQKHLRKLAALRRERKKVEQANIDREAFLIRMGQEVTSEESLNQFIKDNWAWFFHNGVNRQLVWDSKKAYKFHEFHDVRISLYGWNDHVRNSHSCPRNGVQNWSGRDADKPTGYPGWTGRIYIKVKPGMMKYRGKSYMEDGFGSDYFADTTINTGSGGGGGGDEYKEYGYDVKLFADDFPTWRDNVLKAQMWKTLSNGQEVEFA